ncbi:MAG: ABC transporter ATP-binding protein [Bacteroidia bacterium]|nr:ABC transporter ATP-binding protein [Bacteroidia bacterium]
MSTPTLLAEGLVQHFGRTPVLHGISLHVPKGSIYGFLGANGAGKTTTIRTLLGLHHPRAGTIRLFGEDLARHRIAILERTGTLIEHPSYYGHLSAVGNLKIVCRLRGLSPAGIEPTLHQVGLGDAMRKPVKRFSMGMKQRLGLAMALLPQPELLILDEPMSGLDPVGIAEVRQLLLRLNREQGVTIFYSSHILAEVERTATHVGVIDKGRMRFEGTLAELMAQQAAETVVRVNDTTAALATLEALQLTAHVREGRLHLPLLTDEATHALIQQLLGAGVQVYEVRGHQAVLEEQFLQLIQPTSASR